ncbi:MAG: TIGR01777 family protein [Halobacteriovoraceae bacterium]|nr:TIGR01777 family protein [Halobacteriovoraceae bacterium]
MKLLITGATGMVGNRVLQYLNGQGHDITITTRRKNLDVSKLPCKVNVLEWTDNLDAKSLVGIEGVINLMGENIGAKRWSDNQKKLIINSRFDKTSELISKLNLSAKETLKVFVSASAIGIYPKDQISRDENSEHDKDFLAKVCEQWESSLNNLGQNVRKVIFRMGVVVGNGGMLSKLRPIFKLGLGGPIGSGDTLMSWIHVDDIAKLFVEAISQESFEGCYNATAPEVISNKEFTKSLAQSLGRPAFFPVPPFALKLAFGEMSHLMLDSQNIVPKRLIEKNYKFLYPNILAALNSL